MRQRLAFPTVAVLVVIALAGCKTTEEREHATRMEQISQWKEQCRAMGYTGDQLPPCVMALRKEESKNQRAGQMNQQNSGTMSPTTRRMFRSMQESMDGDNQYWDYGY
jgi:hypothetical protein